MSRCKWDTRIVSVMQLLIYIISTFRAIFSAKNVGIFTIPEEHECSHVFVSEVHLLLFITRKYAIINVNLKLINVKICSFYSIYIH